MDGLVELGPAGVPDEQLRTFVADALGVAEVELLSWQVQTVDYDIEALTTAGRYWVQGRARHVGGDEPFAFFVKVVQSWTRTPQFQMVPQHLRERAAAGLPWRGEVDVYRSDLASRLPDGLALPRVHLVVDIDELSACFWLEAVDADAAPWDDSTFERRTGWAASRLGATSPR